jgi:hypothetical protein
MVTYTWEKGPLGDWQVAGSLTRMLTVAMVEVGVVEPDDPVDLLLQATTMKAATIRHERARVAFQAREERPAGSGAVMSSSGADFWFGGEDPQGTNGKGI